MTGCTAFNNMDVQKFQREAHSLKVLSVEHSDDGPHVFVSVEVGPSSAWGPENETTVGLDVDVAIKLADDLIAAATKARR